jgi:hypothetical protein
LCEAEEKKEISKERVKLVGTGEFVAVKNSLSKTELG